MKLLGKRDLMHRYEWRDYRENAQEVSGQPDETPFDPNDGHQVLYMINTFAEYYDFPWRTSGLMAESILKDALPDELSSQILVMAWLRGKWAKLK